MINELIKINPVILALVATIFTWFLTTLGSALVFIFKKVENKYISYAFALSSGIMLAASIFSLINPAIDQAKSIFTKPIIIILAGFICGIIFISLFSKHTSKSKLMILTITLHNIPEGLSVGIAFGMLKYNPSVETFIAAALFALAIGIQNFPEGLAISLPLKKNKTKTFKAFLIGSMSAIVEPIFGILGAVLILISKKILPFSLLFAASAMLYVIINDMIPESFENADNKNNVTIISLIGFIVMMSLDIFL